MNNDVQTQSPVMDTAPKFHPEIEMSALAQEYTLSASYVEQYTRDFQKLDTLVDGVPLNYDSDVPFVADTTLAGLVRSMPRNALQQLPVFSVVVNGSENTIQALVCSYLLKETAFNEDTFGKGLLSTLQIGSEQALTHGYAPFFAAIGSMYNDFGTTMRLLHYSDTAPEPGITDSNESGYHWLLAHLTPTRVKKILKKAEADPNTSWNVAGLKRVLASTPRAKDYSIYESSAKKNTSGDMAGPTYDFRTRYETGQGGTIITYCPDAPEEPLRVLESASKWGYPRVNYLVIDPAALTPFGVSRVRLASPNQNLMNIYYGQIAAMLLLNSKPPIFKKGKFIKPVQLKRGAIWESNDPQAVAELKNMDNGSLQFFPQMQQQFSIQIQNMMGFTTGAPNGNQNSGFSKTAPGVKQQQNYMDLSTNQITKILENFLRQYALVALDTLLSESVDEPDKPIIVDDQTKNAINRIQPGFIGDDNKYLMKWGEFYEAIEKWSIKITVSVSKDEIDAEKRGDLQDMLVVLAQNAQNLGPEVQQKIQEITDMLLEDNAPTVSRLTPTPGPVPTNPGVPAMVAPTAPTPAQVPAGLPA